MPPPTIDSTLPAHAGLPRATDSGQKLDIESATLYVLGTKSGHSAQVRTERNPHERFRTAASFLAVVGCGSHLARDGGTVAALPRGRHLVRAVGVPLVSQRPATGDLRRALGPVDPGTRG